MGNAEISECGNQSVTMLPKKRNLAHQKPFYSSSFSSSSFPLPLPRRPPRRARLQTMRYCFKLGDVRLHKVELKSCCNADTRYKSGTENTPASGRGGERAERDILNRTLVIIWNKVEQTVG